MWKLTPAGVKRQMEWDSPWGKGFPGWHTECVVMSSKFLDTPFDIHCGGIDHIPIHHPNEMAQAQAAFGNKLAKYWLHNEFLTFEGGKMAKSLGNIMRLSDLIEKGFNPLAYRYFCLNSVYRAKMDFSIQGITSSQNALNNLREAISEIKTNLQKKETKNKQTSDYEKQFKEFINDDMNTPKALALMWKVIKDKTISNKEKYALLQEFDKVFCLNIDKIKTEGEAPQEILKLAQEREKYRQQKNWKLADEMRKKINDLGYQVEDTADGPKIKKIN